MDYPVEFSSPQAFHVRLSAEELVGAVRWYAEDNYEVDGWDFLVDGWNNDQIIGVFGDANTLDEAIDRILPVINALADIRRKTNCL